MSQGSGVTEALAAIESNLARLNRPVMGVLRPGLSPAQVQSRLDSRGLPVEEELIALWTWRNGTDTTTGLTLDALHLVPGFHLLSLDDALANFDAFVDDPRWHPAWLPLLANGGGDFLVRDTAVRDGTPIRHFRIEESEHPIEYRSIVYMLATFAAAFDRGIFFVDACGYLEVDDAAYAALAAELNPGVPWWKD